MGVKERNKHARKKLHAGHGSVGKQPVVGARDRARSQVDAPLVPNTTKGSGLLEWRSEPHAEKLWANRKAVSRNRRAA